MIQNTSGERVDTLMRHSDRVYDSIDPIFDGETRHRRILRMSVNVIAETLREGKSLSEAGAQILQLPVTLASKSGPLDTLGNDYADVQRATLDRDGNLETDSRHAVHLMKVAVPYAITYYPKLDPHKIAAYAAGHDLLEAFAGDTPSLGMTPEQERQKNANEAQALLTLKEQYGEAWPEFVAFIEAYEELEEAEARFTKTADKLDPGYTHFYSQGVQLKNQYGLSKESFLKAVDEATVRMSRYSGEFPQLMEDREELTRRVAFEAFEKAA